MVILKVSLEMNHIIRGGGSIYKVCHQPRFTSCFHGVFCRYPHPGARLRRPTPQYTCREISESQNSERSDKKDVEQKGGYEKFKEWWRGPTFKYWFIGGSAFFSWLFYYSLKAYKKTRIEVYIPPPMPPHHIVTRDDRVQIIDQCLKSIEQIAGKVKFLCLQGPTGYGKSMLAYTFAKKEIDNLSHFRLSLPKSQTLVFLNSSSADTFLPSLKGFASKLGVKPAEIKEKCGSNSFYDLSFFNKCDILFELVQEKLEKHPNWIIVFDNLLSTTPQDVHSLVQHWFLNPDKAKEWSKGTVLLTDDGNAILPGHEERILKINKGLLLDDSKSLVQQLTSISSEALSESKSISRLLTLLQGNPLALVCASIILKHKLSEQPLGSIDTSISSLANDIEKQVLNILSNSRFGQMTEGQAESRVLITVEVLVAMAWNVIKSKSPYLTHCIDVLSNGRPGLAVPSFMVLRYLRTPSLQLPPLEPIVPSGVGAIFNKEKGTEKEAELDPVGTPLSNRRIVNWVYKVENWFQETYQVMKELYELYLGSFNLPEEDDGLGFLRECELVLGENAFPGDVKAFQLHPCVYMVCRQNLLSYTAPLLENRYLRDEEMKFSMKPWYRKMQPFDPTLALEQFRKGVGVPPENHLAINSIVQSYNAPVFDLKTILINENETLVRTFESGGSLNRFLHIQAHVARVLAAIESAIKVSPQNVSGKTVSRLLASHLQYILHSQPGDLIGMESRIKSLNSLATVALSVENNPELARQLYKSVLNLQRQFESDDSLAIAYTLTQVANIEILEEENEKSKELLNQAIEIYESHRKKFGEYKKPYEFGKCLALLGIACGGLGEKQKSKDLLERGLMLQQAGAPDLTDPAKGKQFGGEFATSLTDLGHAYIAIGLPLYGKKILDLALVAHKNIHGETHPEVSRTLSLLSIAHLMQGHNEESKKLRKEAGKVNVGINNLPVF